MQTETTLPTLEAAKRAVTETSAAETAAYIRMRQTKAQLKADETAWHAAMAAKSKADRTLCHVIDGVDPGPSFIERLKQNAAKAVDQWGRDNAESGEAEHFDDAEDDDGPATIAPASTLIVDPAAETGVEAAYPGDDAGEAAVLHTPLRNGGDSAGVAPPAQGWE